MIDTTLVALLLDKKMISGDQLRIATTEQAERRESIGKILVRLGFISEATLRDAVGEVLQQASIDLAITIPDPTALALLPIEIARRYSILPVSYQADENILILAMADTQNLLALDQVHASIKRSIALEPLLAGEAEIAHAIDQFYGFDLSIDGILHEIETGETDTSAPLLQGHEYAHPIVRLVDALMSDAVKKGASDIHFEPEQGFLRVRYRIDGVLRQIRSLHAKYWSAIAVRIKVLSQLNIAETRSPQDGQMQLALYGRHVDFRVSVLPTLHGENIVLRILDRHHGMVPLDKLGLSEAALRTLRDMVAQPEGIILVSGPTGSGKTTTLYSILHTLNNEQVNIVTLEDPVELPLAGLRQSAINEAAKLTFASGIRALLRQDPDIILIGEIRDADTATMALRAAMTGHQVYATLHANSALGAIPRLLDIGLCPDILAGSIIGVLAQRLVRRLCLHCRQPYTPDSEQLQHYGIHAPPDSLTLYNAGSCSACDFQGYDGRLALTEIIPMNDDFDECIARRGTLRELRQIAKDQGHCTLADDARRRICEGVTSLAEASRVVHLQRG
ncbi:GspE/PulE family protein [Chrysiogenes arsenatis]|uniref:GspE/PulE family protein n=1 Tax=Chrysiogenes arsenatis TaxID=309797 RepID=UPI00040408A5|nr:GspE/PulE family protein [Chrysiogenes arsenatis]